MAHGYSGVESGTFADPAVKVLESHNIGYAPPGRSLTVSLQERACVTSYW